MKFNQQLMIYKLNNTLENISKIKYENRKDIINFDKTTNRKGILLIKW